MADFGPRKDAEIRRMSCQKVAAELIKMDSAQHWHIDQWDLFKELIDKLEEDINSAGQRAIDKLQEFERQNGKQEYEQASVEVTEMLNNAQQTKLLELLNTKVNPTHAVEDDPEKIPGGSFKLWLWSNSLPNVIPHVDLVKMLTLEQGMTLVSWVNEESKSPNAAS